MRTNLFSLFTTMESKVLSVYLKQCKEHCKNRAKSDYWHVVLGNESCDLDSAVCAITLAHYMNEKIKQTQRKFIVPILNIESSDYTLRTEITPIFKQLNIEQEDLIFKDDLNLIELKDSGKLDVTLVDHNVLTGEFVDLENCVVEVIDHHEKRRPENKSVPVNIEMVGSCATLIAERMIANEDFHIDSDVSVLLYGAILLDTVCLSEQAGRKTVKDEEVVEQLEKRLPKSYNNRNQFFEQLNKAKSDVSGLTNIDLFRKDLKVIRSESLSLAFSSVPLKFQDIDERSSNLHKDLADFIKLQDVSGVVIMTLHITNTGQAQRQIALFCCTETLREKLIKVLNESTNPLLELTPITECSNEHVVVFQQANVTASRKKVLPLLEDFISR